MSDAPKTPDRNRWRVRRGQCVGDLLTSAQCEEALLHLDQQHDAITEQIARVEAGHDTRSKGWRIRTEQAKDWSIRVRKAVTARALVLKAEETKTESRQTQRRKAMLAVIYDEVGEEEFARFAKLTEAKHPQLFKRGDRA